MIFSFHELVIKVDRHKFVIIKSNSLTPLIQNRKMHHNFWSSKYRSACPTFYFIVISITIHTYYQTRIHNKYKIHAYKFPLFTAKTNTLLHVVFISFIFFFNVDLFESYIFYYYLLTLSFFIFGKRYFMILHLTNLIHIQIK